MASFRQLMILPLRDALEDRAFFRFILGRHREENSFGLHSPDEIFQLERAEINHDRFARCLNLA